MRFRFFLSNRIPPLNQNTLRYESYEIMNGSDHINVMFFLNVGDILLSYYAIYTIH